jgi:hypothetical protein
MPDLSGNRRRVSARQQLVHEWLYVFITGLAIFISLSWIWVVAYFGYNLNDAGKGGALGVALSFFMLFGRRNYAKIIASTHDQIRRLMQRIDSIAEQIATSRDLTGGDIDEEIDFIETANAASSGSQAFQNAVLTASSVMGTLAWGFGDWAAEMMRHYHFLVR